MKEIYLDSNATTCVLPAAVAAARQAMEQGYGNPSSTHATGLQAKAMMDGVRRRASGLLGVGDGRLMFNSGATEGIQTAVLSALCALRERRDAGKRIGSLLLYGATEHKAVPESLAHWNRLLGLNLEVRKLPVDAQGRHDLQALGALIGDAAMLCTMAANNETGVVSDLSAIAQLLQERGADAYWMVDCVQALGKLKLNLAATRIDYAPFSGHKLYAPKGIGMLYVRAGAPFTPLMMGGGQEGGLRSGTENMAGIAALGAVLAALDDGKTFRSHADLAAFREQLVASLERAFPGIVFNMPFDLSLSTTLNFSVPGLSSKELLDLFDAARVRVSSGSACSAAKALPSYVLEAMHVPQWRASSAIRLSFGPLIDAATIAAACARIERCGEALRSSCLLPSALAPSPQDGAQDGIIQLGVDGQCTWLISDAASASCVVIDPVAALVPRLAAFIRCQQLALRAIVHTAPPADHGVARLALLQELAIEQVGRIDIDGELALGQQRLRRVECGENHVYLLDQRFAFIGNLAPEALVPLLDAALLTQGTVLCASGDDGSICGTVCSVQEGIVPAAELQLDAAALPAFLRQHPDAILVDVREAYEHAACAGTVFEGCAVHSVPLSRLAGQVAAWLQQPQRPLVFFCRSGNRSARAAACLRRLGHGAAWQLNGGMAMAEATRHPLAIAA
ncbi:aminotransferase class V-fold PLP-dependent enzyme [Janthinobacterium lividum]|uniref:aminotransferase class V-fold PLP-dependent enzyme n=1 Tax=Janthinobacterium lividum TaxID=29581 RepID=UPI000873614D|nr:aminotransferase class V-fold PLP-dependent enzyme [Janthinobacterium lividum]MCC7717302.1 aminotransferase class V-fold PLP-dependent enzyme [Janthinobacterium lividum]OEZ49825.1 cysteine desulfurase NifS [Janthinobacterium lividum]WQE29404.1 aminotransferase class V-fold PLP-dependent enzyme [Janthinobacterium lividum]STQ94882.1 Cysteine desulfurase [Janthinobacterium lividum]